MLKTFFHISVGNIKQVDLNEGEVICCEWRPSHEKNGKTYVFGFYSDDKFISSDSAFFDNDEYKPAKKGFYRKPTIVIKQRNENDIVLRYASEKNAKKQYKLITDLVMNPADNYIDIVDNDVYS